MSHGVSARHGAPHGAALAVLFPHWMAYQLDHDAARFDRFAVQVLGVDAAKGTPKERALEGLRRLRDFYNSLGLPDHLGAFGVREADIDQLVKDVPYRADGHAGFFRPLTAEDVRAIYKLAL